MKSSYIMKKEKTKNIYFVGIKGVGMTMLAQFLVKQGNIVSGSDIAETFLTDKVLSNAGIKVFVGFNPDNIPNDADLIIYSSAYNEKNNPELGYIENNRESFKAELMCYAEALGKVFNNYKGISVCGSHGKTTTTAWLGYVLDKAGKSPNVLVGSRVPQFKGSTLMGDSKLFVAETDEYQNKLKYFQPHGVVLNNIEYDHPDFFKNEASYLKVFRDFVKKIPDSGFLVINNGDKKLRKISQSLNTNVISYDLARNNREPKSESVINYLAYNIEQKGFNQSFMVNNLGRFEIKLAGDYNVRNALAVIAACRELKVPITKIKKYLGTFKGTERRMQKLGLYNQAQFIDDYAHHPTEVIASLSALRKAYKNRNIITVFHPHTYTRTKELFSEFSKSFDDTNELIVLDIYGSAREKQGGTSSAKLVSAINRNYKKEIVNKERKKAVNIKTISEVAKYLKQNAKKGDVVVLMGAGDVFRVWDLLKTKASKK